MRHWYDTANGSGGRLPASKGSVVPLSEDEQRILSEIEQQLYESDPSLARGIADTTVYSDASRQLKWAIAGFVLGLVVMVGTLHIHVLFAVVGVLIMFGSALAIETNLRRMGRAGLGQLSESLKAAGLRDLLNERRNRPTEKPPTDD